MSTYIQGKKVTSLDMAFAVLFERIHDLPKEDKNDLFDLIPALMSDNEEERDSAERAFQEILEQKPSRLKEFDLADPGKPVLSKWLAQFGDNLRGARTRASLTQEELAQRSGIPQSHISRLESGLHSPSAKTVMALASALGVDPGTLDPSMPIV